MKILLVDHCPETLSFRHSLLVRHGPETQTVLNGAEALRTMRKGKYDLVLSEILLPDMDGFELCQRIRSQEALRHLPLVLYGPVEGSEEAGLARAAGADDYFTEPADPETVMERLENALQKVARREPRDLPIRGSRESRSPGDYFIRVAQKLNDRLREADAALAQMSGRNQELEHQLAEQAQALETVRRDDEAFAYSISHDLRAPLRALLGLSGILVEDYSSRMDPEGRLYLDRIGRAAAQMDRMILDLLAYSRMGRLEMELTPVSLESALEEALAQHTALIQETRAVIQVDEPMPRVIGHQAALVQVFGQFISNALQFMKPGTTPRVRVKADIHGEVVRVGIEDNGMGVAPEFHERIFKVFEQLHNSESSPGTGMGLAVVRKAVERMRGRAGVDSALGEGSCFWFELPAAVPRL